MVAVCNNNIMPQFYFINIVFGFSGESIAAAIRLEKKKKTFLDLNVEKLNKKRKATSTEQI